MNMTPRKDLLEDMVKLETPIKIVLADGEVSTMCTTVGKLNLTAVTKDGIPGEVKIEEVAYVPTLESTLLSVEAMAAGGSEFIFKKNGSAMKDSNGIEFPLTQVRNLYYLDCEGISQQFEEVNVVGTEVGSLWHRRL